MWLALVSLLCLVQAAPYPLSARGNFTHPVTNHTYLLYIPDPGEYQWTASGTPTGLNWTEAARNATDQGGYLATITSQAEHNFLMQQLASGYLYPCNITGKLQNCNGVYGNVSCTGDSNNITSGFDLWIGLSDRETEGTWKWVTGTESGTIVGYSSAYNGAYNSFNATNYTNFGPDEPNDWLMNEDCGELKLGSPIDWGCEGPLWNDRPCDHKYGWIVEWDPPTQAPTQTPTAAPTTAAPTNAPCVSCTTQLCPLLLGMSFEPATCEVVQRLGQIGGSWMASPLKTRAAQNSICCLLESFVNQSAGDCHASLNKTLFADVCAQLRGDLAPQQLADFDSEGWCVGAADQNNNLSAVAQCPPLTSATYSAPPNLTTLVIEHALPCVELSRKQYVAKQASFVELGPLAAVQENASQYPDIPPIASVESADRTTALLYNTACLQTTVVNMDWLIWLICFYVVAGCCTLFVWKRRQLLPVRARTPLLLYGSVAWIVVNFTWVALDEITGMTAPCGLISFGNLVAFPMLLMTYLVRSLRLLFLYLSSVSKLAHKRDWFFDRRSWLAPRSAALVLAVALLCCAVVFVVANVLDGTFTDTFLGSGRCKWWDINQAVASAAGTYGVDLGPTDYNQNGFIPYSPEYSSCVFCTSNGTNIFMAALTALLLLLLLASLIAMIRLRDQYLLRLELFAVLCLFSVMAALRVVMFFPQSAQLVIDYLGLDISLLLLSIALLLALLVTTVFPAAMTYSRRYGEREGGTQSVIRKGEPTFEEVLQDPQGLSLFKQFETESFQVENISFYLAMQDLKGLEMSDPGRAQTIEDIYATYIQADSVMEVNIDYHLRSKYLSPESRRGPDVFEDVLKVVQGLLRVNSWLRFRKSPLWKTYLKDIAERQKDDAQVLSQMESTHSFADTYDD